MLKNATESVDSLKSIDVVPGLLKNLYATDSSKNRQQFAKVIYLSCGVATPYQREDGSYILYEPSEEIKQRWIEFHTNEQSLAETNKILKWQLKQMAFLNAVFLGSFFLVFVLGVLILMYGKKDESQTPEKTH